MTSEPLPPPHPTTAMAVANWFLRKCWENPDKPPCDQMKLYKLVFYAHGWFVGNSGLELFPEDVEAWPHGPVVRGIYGEFKRFGRNPITSFGRRLELDENKKPVFVTPTHCGELDDFFDAIWDNYGDKTGIQLSNMTHEKGEPWTLVAENYNYDLDSKPTISTEIIEECFARKIRA